MGKFVERVEHRARDARISRPPKVLANVMAAKGSWERRVRTIVEAFPQRFKFFYPVMCGPGVRARQTGWNPRTRVETYKCPDGTIHQYRRFKTPMEFFRGRYGRCSEFAQGLYSVLKFMGIKSRMVLAYKPGFDHVWVEAWNPRTRKWIPLDATMKKGYSYRWKLGPKATIIKVD
jgi:hypothetical protein